MADLLIKNIDDELVTALEESARRTGNSVEETVRQMITESMTKRSSALELKAEDFIRKVRDAGYSQCDDFQSSDQREEKINAVLKGFAREIPIDKGEILAHLKKLRNSIRLPENMGAENLIRETRDA